MSNAIAGGGRWPSPKKSKDGKIVRGRVGQSGLGAKIVSAQVKVGPARAFGTEGSVSDQTGISIFDPVLCELMYKWFCPPNGSIIDPFAGGSVRGIVAAELGYQYMGCDLSKRQVAANKEQAQRICRENQPVWVSDDSKNILNHAKPGEFDMLFTCPPYAFLEVYSDNLKDISNMPYADFLDAYRDIIAKSCQALKNDRFAVIVVGEVRDKKTGNYVNLVGDTIRAFTDAGMHYYNEMILVTAIGSLPLRAGRVFSSTRKIGKTHQNILVFVKGSAKAAASMLTDVGIAESGVGASEDL